MYFMCLHLNKTNIGVKNLEFFLGLVIIIKGVIMNNLEVAKAF